MSSSDLDLLQEIKRVMIEGVAIRAVNKLRPAEQLDIGEGKFEGGKVMPPTFSERQYAWEDRDRNVILLDSVASHANRQEVLIGKDWERLQLPILRLRFSDSSNHVLQEITSYQASHRVFDALFRDSLSNGVPFRSPMRVTTADLPPEPTSDAQTSTAKGGQQPTKSRGRQATARGKDMEAIQTSEVGSAIENATLDFATPLYKYGPHCLIYGCWDSTGSAGGLGAKFSRAVESRVTGHDARPILGTRGKLDVARLLSMPVFLKHDGNWTVDSDAAIKDDQNQPIRFKLKDNSKGVLSELNHSSVTPDIRDRDSKQPLAGGVTIDHAFQRWVLSIPALRALSFPASKQESSSAERNIAGRNVLTLLALCGLSRLWDEGLWFRSGCTLTFDDKPTIEFVYGRGIPTKKVVVSTQQIDEAYFAARDEAMSTGLVMEEAPIDLTPSPNLHEAYLKSRTGQVADDDASADRGAGQ